MFKFLNQEIRKPQTSLEVRGSFLPETLKLDRIVYMSLPYTR